MPRLLQGAGWGFVSLAHPKACIMGRKRNIMKKSFRLIAFVFISFASLLNFGITSIASAGTLPSNPSTITKAQCESPQSNGGKGGLCVAHFPTAQVDGCSATETFAGFCDSPSLSCCVQTIVPGSITTTSQCTAKISADGIAARCSQNDQNCFKLNISTNVWAPIGYCESPTTGCCLAGAAGGGTSVGSEFNCINTLGGVCLPQSTCNNQAGTSVGSCPADAAGAQRICCKNNNVSGVGSVSGPNLGNYTLLEQIPGSSNTVGTLKTYLEDIYRFAFWAVGIAVVFMLTVGGFMYLTSAGNTSRMESAKTVIFDAILGLILALVAWLFLYVINPDLVNVKLPTTAIAPAPPATTGTTSSTVPKLTDAQCRAAGGAYSTDAASCTTIDPNYFKIGDYVNASGTVSGVCCAATARGTQTCTSVPGVTCNACSNCSVIPSSIAYKPCGLTSCYLNTTLLSKISTISGVSGWRITESWPPTVRHDSLCHANGTCADLNNSGGATDPATIKKYFDAFTSAGLTVIYENSQSCAPYTALGIRCGSYPTQTNLSSFHVQ